MEPACVFRTVPSTSVCALLELVYGLHPAMSVATGTAQLPATHAAHMSRCPHVTMRRTRLNTTNKGIAFSRHASYLL